MNILGYAIDEHGIRPNDELVTGIVEAAVPENKQQLRSFLGLAGFYAKFVPNFSTTVSTMREVQNTEPSAPKLLLIYLLYIYKCHVVKKVHLLSQNDQNLQKN